MTKGEYMNPHLLLTLPFALGFAGGELEYSLLGRFRFLGGAALLGALRGVGLPARIRP